MMTNLEKEVVKKEKEIEKLNQKLKESEEKLKRDRARDKELIKELENQVKEIQQEKQEKLISAEQAVHEKETVLKQLEVLQEENKRLHEDLAQVGVLKAEITGLKLRIENQTTGINEMEQMLLSKDEIIDQLRATESKCREEIRSRNEEIAKHETMISVMKSGKSNIEQSLDQANDKINGLNSEVNRLNTALINRDGKISQLNNQIETLEKEKVSLNQTILSKDDEIAKLSTELNNVLAENSKKDQTISQMQKGIQEAESGLISSALPNLVKGDAQAAERIAEISKRVKANAVLSIPDFEAVPAMLDLDTLRSSTRLRIMTYVDFNNPKHQAIFTQISRPNILIRHNDERNLWGINRDNEEVLIAPRDSEGIPTGLIVKDAFQIEILGNLLLEIWGKCRKNVDQYSFMEQ